MTRRILPACLLAAAVLMAGCTDDATDGTGTTALGATTTTRPATLYTPVGPPTPPAVTTEIPADNVLPDGIYYGVARVGEAPGVVMEMTQLYTGEACLAWAERTGASCDNDYGVDDDPQAFRPVPDDAEVTVARAEGPGTSYRIDAAELLRLVRGEPPAAAAPAGYTYTPFPFLITVRGDRITRVEQWWVP